MYFFESVSNRPFFLRLCVLIIVFPFSEMVILLCVCVSFKGMYKLMVIACMCGVSEGT